MVSSPSLIQSGTYTPLERPVKLRCSVLVATLVACLGPLSFGFVLGYASPVEDQLQDAFNLNNESLSWFNVSRDYLLILGNTVIHKNRQILRV